MTAVYDGQRPHMRVMGIAHVYLAPDDGLAAASHGACSSPPSAGETLGPDFAGRDEPPGVSLALASWRGRGVARSIERPRGRVVRRDGNATVKVDDFSFDPALVSIPRGASVRWLLCRSW